MTTPSTQPSSDSSGDERSLVERVQRGDRGAFESMMRRHNRRLYRLARATLRDEAEAEDALQDAYVAAFRAMGGFRGDCALSTWLSRLVLNECLGRLRRAVRRQNVIPIAGSLEDIAVDEIPGSETEPPDKAAMRAEMRTLLERRLDQLPEIYRVVFVLRSVEELSIEETAECLSITEATVRSRHFKARSLLRESLARDLDLSEPELFDFDGVRCDRVVAAVLTRLEP